MLSSLQSVQWLQASGNAALQHNWGESLAEFVTALSGLVMMRPGGSSVSRKTPDEPSPVTPALELDPAWNEVLLNPLVPNRLSDLQAQNVQLKDMVRNTTLGLYFAPGTERFYCVIAGHVYEVAKPAQQWQIIKQGRLGPTLQRTGNQWQVDLQEGLRGGGAAYSSFETALADEDISLRYTTLASGMKNIAALQPTKYQMLLRAHALSRHYLDTCLKNLNLSSPQAPLPPETLSILQNVFDHPPSDQTVRLLRDYTQRILDELLSASMDTVTSKRLVVGMNMPDQRDTYGFTYHNDPGKRIFLTERVFTLPWDVSIYATPPAIELLAHQQATTLIHELSHQVLRTVDIAYVEAAAPSRTRSASTRGAGVSPIRRSLATNRTGSRSTPRPGAVQNLRHLEPDLERYQEKGWTSPARDLSAKQDKHPGSCTHCVLQRSAGTHRPDPGQRRLAEPDHHQPGAQALCRRCRLKAKCPVSCDTGIGTTGQLPALLHHQTPDALAAATSLIDSLIRPRLSTSSTSTSTSWPSFRMSVTFSTRASLSMEM